MDFIDITEVSKRSGLPASTLRFYEEKGLIRSTGRHGLKRIFPASVVDHLTLISMGQEAGFSLLELKAMFGPGGTVRIDRTALKRKADELDTAIRRLTAMRDGLRHAADCPKENHLDCPTFQRLMKVKQGRPRKARKK